MFLYHDIMVSVSHSLFSPPLRDISTYEKWKQNKKDETNMLNNSAAVLIPLLVLTFMRYTLSFLFLFK